MLIKGEINNLLGVVAGILEHDAACAGEAASDFAMFAALMRATPVDEVRTAPTRPPRHAGNADGGIAARWYRTHP